MKNFVEVTFLIVNDEQINQLIALLADIGYIGFEEVEKTLKAFIDEESFNSDELTAGLKIIPADYSKSIVKEENWNAQWESNFEPIVVKDFVAIRANFHQPIKHVQHEIIITPKMSFGTGHHATTYMMIEQMQTLNFTGKAVVDFGTGTGVLAILAEKMGASSIDAIDYDEWSIENSIENAETNNCTKINLIKAETIDTGLVYNIILANINLNVIVDNLAAIRSVSKKGSFILLSGFIKSDEEIIKKALTESGIDQLKTVQKEEWICIMAQIA